MEGIIIGKNRIFCPSFLFYAHVKGSFLYYIDFDFTPKNSIKNVKYINNNLFLATDIKKFNTVSSWINLIIRVQVVDSNIFNLTKKSIEMIKSYDSEYSDTYFLYYLVKYLGILPEHNYKKLEIVEISRILKKSLNEYFKDLVLK